MLCDIGITMQTQDIGRKCYILCLYFITRYTVLVENN